MINTGKNVSGLVFALLLLLTLNTKQSLAACPGITTLNFNTLSNTGCGIPRAVVFDNVSTGGQAAASGYIWKINGTRVDSTYGTAPHFSYSFLSAGTHTVRLIVVSGTCRDSVQKNINITSAAPRVYDGNGNLSHTPTFNNCIINPLQAINFPVSLSSNAVLNNYRVIWGDGHDESGASLAAGAVLSHTYTTLGLFNLRIITQNGTCYDTLSGSVINMRPVSTSIKPLPAGQLAGCAPHTITFQDTTEFALPGTILTWSFGDGTVITRDWTEANKPISHTYQKEASQQCIFTVTLRAFNPNCNTGVNNASTYSISPILIFDEDIARINPPTNLCEPSLTYTFGNSSTDNCITGTRWYYWDWGDGTNSGWINSKAPQTHTYPRIDTFTVMLIDSNACGSDTTYATVVLNRAPDVGYMINPKSGCAPLSVTFQDTSTGIGNSVQWQFNGTTPTTSASRTTTRTFTNPGTFPVRLRVSNTCATNVTRYDTIRVFARPNVQIGNAVSGCVPHTVQFQNNTVNQSPDATYFWDFGNGVTSAQRNPPAATYDSTGTFTVKLVVSDTCGKDSQLVTIKVSTLPVVSFTATNVCRGSATTFTNTSSLAAGDTVAAFKWYYGNGDSSAAGTAVQNYTYPAAGNYPAVLRITTDKNCVASDTLNVNVKVSPSVSIAAFPTICHGNPVTMNGTASSAAPTSIAAYQWTFGTGDTARVEDTLYRFPAPASYNVRLTATNSVGCSATANRNAVVRPLPDARPFVAPLICRGQQARFTDSSVVSGPGNTITRWAWDFDNNGTIDDTTQHPVFTYATAGTGGQVKLTVTTNHQCSNTDSVLHVTVHDKPEPAIADNGPALCRLDTFRFTNSTTAASSYTWSFGDTSSLYVTGSTDPVSHVYADTGSFVVRLVATSAAGCKDSVSRTVVSRPLPQAAFTVNDTIGCAPKQFSFTNTSALAGQYRWLVGNAQTSTSINRPDTLVNLSGQVITVKLIAGNVYGCRPDTAVRTLYTFGNPTPDFTMSTDSGCGPLQVSFTNTTPNGISYTWRLGNGETQTTLNAGSTYLPALVNDSIYTIRLIASNGPGCSDSVSKTVKVFPQPVSAFSHMVNSGCGPLEVSFVNNSQHNHGGNISNMSFAWDFGNGNTSPQQSPVSSFYASALQDTAYTIRLIAFSRYGCSDTSVSMVKVFPNPRSSFSPVHQAGCGPHQTAFTNTSVPNDTGSISIMSFAWDFGNGATSAQQSPLATFVASNTIDSIYNVRLVAFSEHGCRDTSYRSVRVYPDPLAAFTPSVTGGCGPLGVSFTNQSVPNDTGSIGIMSFVWDFDNGFSSVAVNPATQFTAKYLQDTTYRVKLLAISEHGCRDSVMRTIVVHPDPVTAFTIDRNTGCGPFPVQFTSSSQLADRHFWDFGAGDTSMQVNPRHVFRSYPVYDSLYEVKLTTRSVHGCPGDTQRTTITARYLPLAGFFASADSICGGGNVAFYNVSLGGAVNSWDFANGQTSAGINPAATFSGLPARDTTYNVRLVVTTPYGCRDTAYGPLKVNALPEAVFDEVSPGCTPHPVTFTNTSLRAASYKWDFGDATMSDSAAPARLFTNPTALVNRVYPVTLTAISAGGCIDTMKRNIVVYPLPLAGFTANKTTDCDTAEFRFLNASQGASAYTWRFGDGSSSTGEDPVHFYRTAALQDTSYLVELTSVTSFGCRDSASRTVVVHPIVQAGFAATDTSSCGPLGTQFINRSVNAVNYYWEFGDGAGSNKVSPGYTYSSTGTYPVRLTAYDQYGCSDTATEPAFIRVYEVPKAVFYYNPLQPRQPSTTVNFYDSSVLSAGTLAHSWNFGDAASGANNLSLVKDPSHTYSDSGDFAVRLIVSSNNGCKDTAIKQLRVLPYLPVPGFTWNPPGGCQPHTVTFTNTSQYASSYEWDFGDGQKSTSVNPQHTYPNEGKYTVSLIARGPGGQASVIKDTIITVYPLPKANFTWQKSQRCDTAEIIFSNSSQGLVNSSWYFGDGTQSSAENPVHFYRTAALSDSSYTVKLVTTTAYGCRDSIERTVLVRPLVRAAFSAAAVSGCGSLNAQFVNRSENAVSYYWEFGDGAGSNQAAPAYTYNSAGLYHVKLTAYDSYGCSDTALKANYITINEVPKAVFYFSPFQTRQPNTTVSFFDSSFIGSGSITHEWNFGDPLHGSNTSTLRNPVHTYSDSGEFVPVLVVTSDKGCRDTLSKMLRVLPFLPVPDFTWNPSAGCQPHKVTFTNTSLHAQSYEWDFGDGSKSTQEHPEHTYAHEGKYTVSLVATGPGGRIENRKDTIITVYPLPRAGFSATRSRRCDTTEYSFLNTSQGASSYLWSFGDHTGSTLPSPDHYYRTLAASDISYTVKLVVSTPYGCKDSMEKTITVHPLVKAHFSSVNTSSCQDFDVTFSNGSRNGSSYFWLFGDGAASSLHTPVHKYASSGSYNVTLVAYDSYGCTDTAHRTNFVNVFEVPRAAFLFSPVDPRQPAALVDFTDVSYAPPASVLGYAWDFGDPASSDNSSVLRNPSHLFSDSGTFNVKLKVTSSNGCTDSSVRVVYVSPRPPVPRFTFDPPSGCRPHTVSFNSDSTLYGYGFQWEFGDGSRSSEKNPVHVYRNASNVPYTVMLVVTGPGGRAELVKDTIITVYDLPKPNFVANPVNLFLPEAHSVFTNLSFGAASAKWRVFDEDNNTIFTDTAYNSGHSFGSKGRYGVTMYVQNEHGCRDSITRDALVNVENGGNIFVPTAFSPNGDNSNEIFMPVVVGVRKEDYEFRIYDRWGRQVFESGSPDVGWDGKISGEAAVTDVYVWIIEGTFVTNERFVKKGSVTLLR